MTEEQLAQIEAGAIRLPIGAKDRKGVDICLGDTVHFADAAEWGAADTPRWTVHMEGGKLPQPGSSSDLARFCEVVGTDGVDPAAIAAEVRRLQELNQMLRDDFNTAHEYSRAAEVREFEAREEVRRLQAENAALRAEVKAAEDGFVAAADQSRILAGDLAALRARAVPELRFSRMGVAESGQFIGCVADNGDWGLGMYVSGILISIEDGTGGKAAMDAAFLRLVGVPA